MNQDEIIQMLRKVIAENQQFTTWTVSTPHLVELVNHAIKAEREACAKVCESREWGNRETYAAQECATAIRARGQE